MAHRRSLCVCFDYTIHIICLNTRDIPLFFFFFHSPLFESANAIMNTVSVQQDIGHGTGDGRSQRRCNQKLASDVRSKIFTAILLKYLIQKKNF